MKTAHHCFFGSCLTLSCLATAVALLGGAGLPAAGAAAGKPADLRFDLLAAPLETSRPYAWKHFSEAPQTKLADVWQLQDGLLVCRGTPKGYLYLDHDFTDFVLRLEWRWPEGKKPGNGGVLVRITGADKIWPRSLEAQINAGQAGDFWGLDGFALEGPAERKKSLEHAQFGRLTNLKRAADLEKPAGQWNDYEIIARGSTVILRLNGQEVNRATGCDVRAGKICLTAEGDEIHFRNARLQESPAAKSASLRPPAVPLVAHDPYFSIWSPADKLTDADTMHWTGKPHRLTSLVRIDGKAFRIMGTSPTNVPALPQTGVEVTPTRTICTFEGEGVRVTLTFMTPALPDDLEVLSRPVTYVTYDLRALDGEEHELSLYFDAAANIAVNTPEQLVEFGRAQRLRDLRGWWIGSKDQPVLAKKGDDLRIDWGRFYVAASAETMVAAPSASNVVRRGFLGQTPTDIGAQTPSPIEAQFLTAACWSRFLKVGAQPATSWLMLAYDDEYSIKCFRQNLRPYWRRNGDDAAALLNKAAADYESLKVRCEKFDAELMADLRKVGGEKYAQLCALAYRQTLAGNKIVADANGQPLMFPKENFSNGCIGTVDVLFPQAPFFLVFSPALTKAMLVPILDYAASPRWPYGYAPHDLGTYPHATGQVYGMGGKDGDRMPVEESGNMLIMLAALAIQEGNANFAKPYWPMLTKWADYLVKEGLDPQNQLCSADMFGHLPRNANLALKAIIGIGGYAQLCELAGQPDDAKKYLAVAHDYAAKWQEFAKDDGRTVLAYGQRGTWAMKHNLIWDRILTGSRRRESAPASGVEKNAPTHVGGYEQLFPDSVGDAEIAWYLKVQKKFGLPVDNRTDTCLIDWALWSIAPARHDADFQALLDPIWRYANETPSRVPLSDWFVTTSARMKGFQARPVVGGIFIKMLADAPMWTKWARRGVNTKQ